MNEIFHRSDAGHKFLPLLHQIFIMKFGHLITISAAFWLLFQVYYNTFFFLDLQTWTPKKIDMRFSLHWKMISTSSVALITARFNCLSVMVVFSFFLGARKVVRVWTRPWGRRI